MGDLKFKIYRGDNTKGELVDYNCDVTEGMVVLDAMHRIQADDAKPIDTSQLKINEQIKIIINHINHNK